jgi:hypothetical protein
MQNLYHENYLFLTRHQWLHLFQSQERTIDRGGFGQQEKGLQISLEAQFLHCLSNGTSSSNEACTACLGLVKFYLQY